MDAGVAGGGMRYNVYVVTVSNLWPICTPPRPGPVVGPGRLWPQQFYRTRPHLAFDSRQRKIGSCPPSTKPPPTLFPNRPPPNPEHCLDPALRLTCHASRLLLLPDVGLGRDETLLASTALTQPRFAARLRRRQNRYRRRICPLVQLTGGLDGPVLFTSLEQYNPLARC
jgi:hypothetical protein